MFYCVRVFSPWVNYLCSYVVEQLKVKLYQKKAITQDTTRSRSWHGHNAENMVRSFFADRQLGALLGRASFGKEDGMDYVQFEYLQPVPLEGRGVDWLDEDVMHLVRGGHGTYWETASKILATGTLTNSDSDDTFGGREWHGDTGVYMTPNFIAWAGHYSWPCNVFGNRAFYGIGTKLICNDKYLKRVLHHPNRRMKEERVYEPRGCVITHVVVTYNRSIAEGHSRARYFQPRCEFIHGVAPIMRKYPDLRNSVWRDSPVPSEYETFGRAPELPIHDTHDYVDPWAHRYLSRRGLLIAFSQREHMLAYMLTFLVPNHL